VKFTDEGMIGIEVKDQKDQVKVSIRDSGIGIKETDLDKLFKPFSQIPIEGRLRREGTGLGLYLSKKIANLLGGEIVAESEFGEGSVFTLALPLKHKDATL
jgi:signal transduction histidine kinase